MIVYGSSFCILIGCQDLLCVFFWACIWSPCGVIEWKPIENWNNKVLRFFFIFTAAEGERRAALIVIDGFSPVTETECFRCMFDAFLPVESQWSAAQRAQTQNGHSMRVHHPLPVTDISRKDHLFRPWVMKCKGRNIYVVSKNSNKAALFMLL